MIIIRESLTDCLLRQFVRSRRADTCKTAYITRSVRQRTYILYLAVLTRKHLIIDNAHQMRFTQSALPTIATCPPRFTRERATFFMLTTPNKIVTQTNARWHLERMRTLSCHWPKDEEIVMSLVKIILFTFIVRASSVKGLSLVIYMCSLLTLLT